MDLEDFEEQLRGGDVRIFLLCSPHNPVGRVWTREELRAVGELCLRYGVRIFSDEIHSDLLLDGHRHCCTAAVSPEIAAITTTFMAPSKTFNLAGLQASTILFPDTAEKEDYVAELKRMDIARNSSFSLVAAMTAYNDCADWVDELCAYLAENMRFLRDFCAAELPELRPNTPEATYLNWVDCSGLGLGGNEEIVRFCVERAGIAPGRGADFGVGGEQFIRINAACPRATLEQAVTRLRDAVRRR